MTKSDSLNESKEPDWLQLDVSDPEYAALTAGSDRIAKLLQHPKIAANADVAGLLDDFLGAIYSLVFAKQRQFEDRLHRTIDPQVVFKRAEKLATGKLRDTGNWAAGYYFNGALLRLAAVYHRALKIVTGQPTTRDWAPVLKPKADALYQQWTGTTWSNQNVAAVHDEVNDLKHTPKGIHDRRTVSFQTAVSAVAEMLALIEMWAANIK